jgi:hypothetical protein
VWDRPDHIAASPADRAREALLDDPARSNAEIALAVRSMPAQVRAVRKALADYGLLPATPWPRRAPPRLKALPAAPRVLAEGACVGHARPDLWTSSDPAEREFARSVCLLACHVAAACFEWSLSLPVDDRAIYGAGTADDRERVRRERAGRPLAFGKTTRGRNAARDCRRAAAAAARDGVA